MKIVTAFLALALSIPANAQDSASVDFPTIADHVTSGIQVEASQLLMSSTSDSGTRALTILSLNMIEVFESWQKSPYNDASMYCTIGYGHLVAKKPCAASAMELGRFKWPLSEDDGASILASDTKLARSTVQSSVNRQLTDGQFGALVSFVFNVGGGNFRSSSMLKYINGGEDEAAAREFPKWVKSKGVVLPGLVARRSCEAALFLNKLPPHPNDAFKRTDCDTRRITAAVGKTIDIEIGEASGQ